MYSLPTYHNALVISENKPKHWSYWCAAIQSYIKAQTNPTGYSKACTTVRHSCTRSIVLVVKRMPLLHCSDAWLPIAANHTFAGDPTPRVDKLYDGGPLKGWMPSSGYNAIVALGPDSALVCYDQMGWGGGNYGIGLPPIFGSQGEWPKGQSAYPGCYRDVSMTYCMRISVSV